ncbi:DEAD/DEAH box helicase [Clostridium botulinum]|nr:DEAD/DEAH box helicase [Clostridium botulinum]
MKIETANKYFEKYEKDSVIQNYIAQAKSRYILYNANEPEENFPRYTEGLDKKCTHLAFGYIEFGLTFLLNDEKEKSDLCMERAGGVLEHLFAYKKCNKKYKEYFCLVCALTYYSASQYSKSFIVMQEYTCKTPVARMVKAFLTRNFGKLEETIRNVQFDIRTNDDWNDIKHDKIYSKILSDALIQMLQYIYNGRNESLENAKNILIDLIDLTDINEEPHLWWIFRLLKLVFGEYKDASLWNILPPIIPEDNKCKDYIYANIFKEPPIVELFKSQKECIGKIADNDVGFIIGIPTSSGKTKIAEITIVKTLFENPDSLCVYIAPFRSLATEVENGLSGILSVIGFGVSHLYGNSQATQLDRESIKKANVIIATPEKIKSILRSNDEMIERIKLVIVDEGHLVGGEPRYITSELLVEELKICLKKNGGKLVMLSAVLPNLSEFAKWISGNTSDAVKSSWRPSEQRFGVLDFNNNSVDLKWPGEPVSFNNNFIEAEIIKPSRKTKTGRIYKAKYFPEDKKEAVGATAVKMLLMGSVLIYVGRSTMVFSQARIVSKLFKEQKIEHSWDNSNDLKYVELACEEAYGENSEILSFIKQGIICHSSKLPTDVRQSIERLMINGTPKVIIATSTLGQGVNIGVSTVIISNVYLDQDNVVKVKDFWNIAGRAGRAFTDTEGKILYAIDRTKNNYSVQNQFKYMNTYFKKENVEQARSGIFLLLRALYKISQICNIKYEIFLELLAENSDLKETEEGKNFFESSNRLLDLLDDTLISMDIKQGINSLEECTTWIDDVFRGSLAYIQAESSLDFTQEQIIDVLKARNKGVVKLAGDYSKWKAIACSSIPLNASIYIDSHIGELNDSMNKYLTSQQLFSDMMELIKQLDMFVAGINMSKDDELIEIAMKYPIRSQWYGGISIEDISKINDKAVDVCNKYYGFNFPWIINAVAKKMKIMGKKEESKILEDISLFSEIGVADIESTMTYLSGIRSRESAQELSKLIDIDDMSIMSVKGKLLDFKHMFDDGQEQCSQQAYKWLQLLVEDNKQRTHISLTKMTLKISYEHCGKYDVLYAKDFEERIYLCSYDYKIRIKIKEKLNHKLSILSKIQGLYFVKTDNDSWDLKTINPYITIV